MVTPLRASSAQVCAAATLNALVFFTIGSLGTCWTRTSTFTPLALRSSQSARAHSARRQATAGNRVNVLARTGTRPGTRGYQWKCTSTSEAPLFREEFALAVRIGPARRRLRLDQPATPLAQPVDIGDSRLVDAAASIGAATPDRIGTADLNALQRAADAAMHDGKHTGRAVLATKEHATVPYQPLRGTPREHPRLRPRSLRTAPAVRPDHRGQTDLGIAVRPLPDHRGRPDRLPHRPAAHLARGPVHPQLPLPRSHPPGDAGAPRSGNRGTTTSPGRTARPAPKPRTPAASTRALRRHGLPGRPDQNASGRWRGHRVRPAAHAEVAASAAQSAKADTADANTIAQ